MAKKLEKSIWGSYFDTVSKALAGKRVEIEVASLKLGDQVEVEWLPLSGITYDPKDDLIEVALEGVDHLIRTPRGVWIEGKGLNLSAIDIVDAGGVRHIVTLRDPLMLPAPQQAKQAG
jgi:hypothetical protein